MDKGYDIERVYSECAESGVAPIVPLRQTSRVVRGEDKPPTCEQASGGSPGPTTSARRPSGAARPASASPPSRWVKADRLHPLVPRETSRWRKLYKQRGAFEREFGRLKHDWALTPLRVRGLDRVRLYADLTILAKLASHLARARTVGG